MKQLHILVIFTVILGIWNLDASAQNVNFPDANLETEVRKKLTIPANQAITRADLETITTLIANTDKGITNLTGLQYATNLRILSLKDNSIGDFTPIRSLTNLQNLGLINTGFSDSDIPILSPLVNLQNALTLAENRISNLQALVDVISDNMPNLTALDIGENRFCDITPLTALKDQLTVLDLDYIKISNFGPLSEFTNLTELYLRRTGITDLSLLSGLTNLTRLQLTENGISNLEPLSRLTNLTRIFLDRNQITDLSPLSGLTSLTHLWACWNPFPTDPNPFASLSELTAMEDFSVDTTYQTQAETVFPAAALQYFCNPANAAFSALQDFCSTPSETTLNPERESELEAKRRRHIVTQCGLGWTPLQYNREVPKVMIYALEFEYDPERHGRYTCKTIEIRTGDDSIENLAGWKLYLGTLYNPSSIPITIPEAYSQVTDNVLRITPEMLGLEAFPSNTVGGISHPLPGVQYVLKTDENILVDTAFSCFIWGQNAWTTVNGVNVKSQRRISSAALREMETPRLERYISNNIGVFITYMDIEAFTWDRMVLSDWLLAASESSAPGAPSAIQRKLVTTWGALKKQ